MTATTSTHVIDTIRAYLSEHFPDRAAEIARLAPDVSLFALGFIDSLFFLNLVSFIEERFAISVPALDFAPDNFRTLNDIMTYISIKATGA